MHKYIALFFSVLVFLCACTQHKTDANVIPIKQMTSLMVDIHIVDGRMYSLLQNPDTLYKYGSGKYLALFKKHHTDSAQFSSSFKYYASQPTQFLAMYDDVMAILKKKLDSLNQLQTIRNRTNNAINTQINKRIADSLRKSHMVSPTKIVP